MALFVCFFNGVDVFSSCSQGTLVKLMSCPDRCDIHTGLVACYVYSLILVVLPNNCEGVFQQNITPSQGPITHN